MDKQWRATVREIWRNKFGRIYAIGRYYESVEQARQHWTERVADGRELDSKDTPEYEMV